MIFIVFATILAATIALVALVYGRSKLNDRAPPSMKIAYRWGTYISASLLLYAVGGAAFFIYTVQYDPGFFARHQSWAPHPYIFGGTLVLAFLLFWPVALATLALRYFVPSKPQ